jgi:hypothetical protein
VDVTAIWAAVAAIGTVATGGIAAVSARQSRQSARESNNAAKESTAAAKESTAAAKSLAAIEADRRHSEMTPQFRVVCEPSNPGADTLTLRVILTGPPGLYHLNGVTVRIRDDYFRRGDYPPLGGSPSREEIKAHIWGPYRFRPGTGPDEGRADETGRVTPYEEHSLPVGEELLYLLEPTWAPRWSSWSPEDWRRQIGDVIRLTIEARRRVYGTWTLPCEIDVGDGQKPVTITVP